MNGCVVITAAGGALARQVCALVAGDPDVERIVAVDRPDRAAQVASELAELAADTGTPIEVHGVDLRDPDLKGHLEGATTILHLGAGDESPGRTERTEGSPGLADGTRALLDVAAATGARTVVLLSSAMVYGAWPNNPVPLTEAAPLRPVPELRFAVELAEAERLAAAWRDGQPAGTMPATVAILRAAPSPGLDGNAEPSVRAGVRMGENEPPVQFLDLSDLATAVEMARRGRLDGPYNVAPDGWLTAAQVRALRGPAARLPLPAPIVERLAAARWTLGLTRVPPSVLPYARYPWVVANDRLKSVGWLPRRTNEEAFVEVAPPHPLTEMPPGRRQALSLAVLGAGVAGVVAVTAVAFRAWRRRALR